MKLELGTSITLATSMWSARSPQNIEGFGSLVKHGVVGTFHKLSAEYLPLSVAEFEFRYNNHLDDDIFGTAIRKAPRREGG